MSLAAKMFQLLRETPEALVAYQEDFMIHDMKVINESQTGDAFVWVVRNHGTHLCTVGGNSGMTKAVLESSDGIVMIRLVTVTRGVALDPSMDSRYPDGDLTRLSKAEALELIRRRDVGVAV